MVFQISELRDPKKIREISNLIKRITPKGENYRFIHVCGTHEQVLTQYGLRDLLPSNVELIAGPGCPVCVVPSQDIDAAIELAKKDVIITTFGDMGRVPGSEKSLLDAKTEGADVRIVYGPNDATEIARKNPNKPVIFFAIGFETTIAIVAAELKRNPPKNFSIICSHKTIPAAMNLLIATGELQIDGFISPGHVSTIIGTKPYEVFPRAYKIPVVVTGFEPMDILLSIFSLIKQKRENKLIVDNQYKRAVRPEGNLKAMKIINEFFEIESVHWRGIGRISEGGYKLKVEALDALKRFDIKIENACDIRPGCICHLVMIGKMKPENCKLFDNECTPIHPYGPCMVSHEGTCNIQHRFGNIKILD
ncbi:MAG: hydrogenase formation protein HypD [Candidatus Helarchaeota archaeon]